MVTLYDSVVCLGGGNPGTIYCDWQWGPKFPSLVQNHWFRQAGLRRERPGPYFGPPCSAQSQIAHPVMVRTYDPQLGRTGTSPGQRSSRSSYRLSVLTL